MEQKILNNLSYGLFVITANRDGVDNGCMSNTVIQVAFDPMTVSVALNKGSLTCEMIRDTNRFTASILSEETTFDVVKRFGFSSGRSVNKFENFKGCMRLRNGTMAITTGANAYISVDVTSQIDLKSHILFLGTPVEGKILTNIPSATYAYYFSHIKE